LRAVDQDNQGLVGVVFNLLQEEPIKMLQIAVSDIDGNATFTNVPNGKYRINKARVMPGFTTDSHTYRVSVKNRSVCIEGQLIGRCARRFGIRYTRIPLAFFDDGSFAFELLKNLASAAASALGSEIGSTIFNYIFNSKKTNPFNEAAYKEIAKIVKKEVIKVEVEKISGELNGIITFVATVYNPRKEKGGSTKKSQYDSLKPHYDKLFGLMGILTSNEFSKPGFPVFLVCAYQTILLSQELAQVDPEYDPQKSPFRETIKLLADRFLKHAENTRPWLDNDRRSFFTMTIDVIPSPGGGCYVIKWKDKLTGTSKSFSTSVDFEKYKRECEISMENAKDSAVRAMRNGLRYDEFINNMNKLKDRPLP